jgi:hypothetical protein
MTGVLGWVLVLVTGVIKSEQLGWGKHRVLKKTVANLVEIHYHRTGTETGQSVAVNCNAGWAGPGWPRAGLGNMLLLLANLVQHLPRRYRIGWAGLSVPGQNSISAKEPLDCLAARNVGLTVDGSGTPQVVGQITIAPSREGNNVVLSTGCPGTQGCPGCHVVGMRVPDLLKLKIQTY